MLKCLLLVSGLAVALPALVTPSRANAIKHLVLAGAIAALLPLGCGGTEEDLEGERDTFALPSSVEKWRKLVEKHFKYENVTWGLNIIKCESGGNPNAYNKSSGASGLFQHLAKYWPPRAKAAGFPGASPFNAEANIAASAMLLHGTNTGAWSCKYSPLANYNYKPQYYKNGKPVEAPAPAPAPAPQPAPPPCVSLPSGGGIIDDGSPCFDLFGPSARWHAVSGKGNATDLLWTEAAQRTTASNWARWNVKLAAAKDYTVKYYAVDAYAMFKSARYVVRHAGKNTTLTVDQSSGGSGWRTLGTFSFAAGGDQYVAVYDNTAAAVASGQRIVVDAVRLDPADTPPPPAPTPPAPTPPAPTPPAPTPAPTKAFGDTCTDSSECGTQLCALDPSLATSTCNQLCGGSSSACPAGTTCQLHDGVTACFKAAERPFGADCDRDSDCPGKLCLSDATGARYCSSQCADDPGACPTGSTCRPYESLAACQLPGPGEESDAAPPSWEDPSNDVIGGCGVGGARADSLLGALLALGLLLLGGRRRSGA